MLVLQIVSELFLVLISVGGVNWWFSWVISVIGLGLLLSSLISMVCLCSVIGLILLKNIMVFLVGIGCVQISCLVCSWWLVVCLCILWVLLVCMLCMIMFLLGCMCLILNIDCFMSSYCLVSSCLLLGSSELCILRNFVNVLFLNNIVFSISGLVSVVVSVFLLLELVYWKCLQLILVSRLVQLFDSVCWDVLVYSQFICLVSGSVLWLRWYFLYLWFDLYQYVLLWFRLWCGWVWCCFRSCISGWLGLVLVWCSSVNLCLVLL